MASPLGDSTTRPTAFTDFAGALPMAQLPNGLFNTNSALQSLTVVSGTAVYVTKSNIALPATLKTGIVVGTTVEWDVWLTKSAAGTGTFQIVIYMGTNGTTADTATVSQSIGTQTAVVDHMQVRVKIVFTAVGAGTGSFFWSICPINSAVTAVGFGVVTGTLFTGTVSSLTTTTASLQFGLGFIATTGTPVITVPYVEGWANNLA